MINILYELYSNLERRPIHNSEYTDINDKIKSERLYFESVLCPEDSKRLQALENLYAQSEDFEETEAFISGFKLGVKLIFAAFCDEIANNR